MDQHTTLSGRRNEIETVNKTCQNQTEMKHASRAAAFRWDKGENGSSFVGGRKEKRRRQAPRARLIQVGFQTEYEYKLRLKGRDGW